LATRRRFRYNVVPLCPASVLVVHSASPIDQHAARIAEFAIGHGIVTLGFEDFQVRVGCLLAYSPDNMEKFRRLAYFVDRILRGAAPSDLPVELATYRLIINRATARALRLTIPPAILARTDEVIE
jgi:putative ABC transport system substrate-binding protein